MPDMSQKDFDINGLATYLHLTRDQVLKLVERGKLPGRRIGGQWRFAQADVHHWWEERIGASGDAELVQVEQVLQRTAGHQASEEISLAESLPREAISVPLLARTRSSVITAMVELADRSGRLWDAPRLEEAVRARENLHPTALDNGVALLHPRRPMPAIVSDPFLAVGITSQGIPFGGSRSLTDVFFLICSTDDRWHLRALARLSRLLTMDAFLYQLRAQEGPDEVRQLVAQFEETLRDSR
jgi:PTS system nitrogen regulatory IIA component